jgi:ribosomal protein S26
VKEKLKIPIESHFTVSYHGKSECDAMCAVFKRSLRTASDRDRKIILNATEAFDYCKADLTTPTLDFVEANVVRDQKTALKNRYKITKTVPGTRSYHAVVPLDEAQVEVKRFTWSVDSKRFPLFEGAAENRNMENPIVIA